VRGTFFVGYDGHCATSAGDTSATHANTTTAAIADLTHPPLFAPREVYRAEADGEDRA
jgi:hypothetical protein